MAIKAWQDIAIPLQDVLKGTFKDKIVWICYSLRIDHYHIHIRKL